MSIRVIPLMDRLLIEPIETEQKTAGGIVIAGTEQKIPYLHGKVLAMGPGKQKASGEYIAPNFKIGDTVVYGNVSSTLEDMQDGKKVLLVESNAVVARLLEIPDTPQILPKISEADLLADPVLNPELYKQREL